MSAFLVALALLLAAVAGVYLLLKSMGQNGVEAAAPGSCKSGRCGVQPKQTTDAPAAQVIQLDDIRRKDALPDDQARQ